MQQKIMEVEETTDKNSKGTAAAAGGGGSSKVVPQLDPLHFLLPIEQGIGQAIFYPRAIKSVLVCYNWKPCKIITMRKVRVAWCLNVLDLSRTKNMNNIPES